jgi:aryl-alcohol dehydrogenase-like predicted oxidoreductase
LAWVLAQGNDIVPIPGTKQRKYLEENVASLEIKLSQSELQALKDLFPIEAIAGKRYTDASLKLVNQ